MDVAAEWHQPERGEDVGPMQVPEPGGRIRLESRPRQEEESVFDSEAHAHP